MEQKSLPLAPSALSQEEHVQIEQLDMAERLIPLGVLFIMSVMEVNAWLFWAENTKTFIIGAHVVGLSLCALVIYRAYLWQSRPRPAVLPPGRIREGVLLTALGSTILGICLTYLFEQANMSDKGVVMASTAGMISAVVCFAPVTVIALAYLVPVTALGMRALLSTGDTNYMIVAVLLLVYALFLTFLVHKLSALIRQRVISELGLERERGLTAQLLQDFEHNANDWLWQIDSSYALTHASARLAELLGLNPDDLHGTDMFARLSAFATPQSHAMLRQMSRRVAQHQAFRDCEISLVIDGDVRWWRISGKPVFDPDGTFGGYRGVGVDTTDKKAAEHQVSFLAMHDSLTHLPNRSAFNQRLTAAVDGLVDGTSFAVMCLDLDDFKNINDCFGHAMGDALLKQVAKRMLAVLGPDDHLVRMAGDEFCILFTGNNAADRAALQKLGQAIIATIAEPFPLEDITASIGVSIGVALAPADGLDETVRRADLALYTSKRQGKNALNFYNPAMDEQVIARRALGQDLKQALSKQQFLLHFQPLVNAATTSIQGFEALVRWKHPELGMISPAEFIPLAEETGLINALGEWVLNEACRHAVQWPPHLKLAVNVSPIQFHYSDLPGIVGAALATSGLAPERLELELTESAFLEATPNTKVVFERLRRLGVKLSLDDFGTGFSSLAYLRQMPFDKVKIDRSFVQDLPANERDLSIIRAVIDIATTMGMAITAEGVETESQSRCLVQQGCHQLQGFLFSRPVSAGEALKMAAQNAGAASQIRA